MRPSKTLKAKGGQIELLDLFIKALEDHEKHLEELSQRLEGAIRSTKGIAKRGSGSFSNWESFVRKVRGKARLVAYKVEDGMVTVSALVGNTVRRYVEPIPAFRLDCPLELKLEVSLDPELSRARLSEALEVPEGNVIEAK
jgi:hypothetical protein